MFVETIDSQKMTISPSFVSLVDEANRPLFVYVTPSESEDVNQVLKYNVLSNLSLDYFENDLFDWSFLETQPDIKALFNLEGVAVYGMIIKQTGLKIIIGFLIKENIQELNDDEISEVFMKVKKIYLRAKLNPFVAPSSFDDSKELSAKLQKKFSEEL